VQGRFKNIKKRMSTFSRIMLKFTKNSQRKINCTSKKLHNHLKYDKKKYRKITTN
jgi:hypothetical protein